MAEERPAGAAIVGMATVFPGAPDLGRFWENIAGGVDAVSDLPPGRLDEAYFDATSNAPDRLYCRRGGFLPSPLSFDAAAFGIMPVAAQGAEPDQLLALGAAKAALDDAGFGDRGFARDRTAVILGRGGYLTAGVARLEQRVRTSTQLVETLRTLLPDLDEAQLAAVKADFQSRLPPFGADTAIGLVPNLAASRIANRLDLHGAAYTVDGACASSLLAVDHACRELAGGAHDLVIAGGVHLCHDPTFWSVFCQLGALSRSERIRPFHRGADGLLIGEGVGMLVLKRLADAERDGDRIYAVVRGTGVSSDGRAASLMTPSVDGQVMALERAWRAAQMDPASVGLVEAHGTATPAGDAAEVETLRRVFGPANGAPRAVVGSVKSMIGHAMPAAGAASLIKTALALHHRVLPPTLHCDEPRPELEATRFRTLSRAEPWEGDGPRRAAVNAFGFGGINAHVVLESHGTRSRSRVFSTLRSIDLDVDREADGHSAANTRRSSVTPSSGSLPVPLDVLQPGAERILLLAADSPDALVRAIECHTTTTTTARAARGPARIAVFDPTPERLARAAKIVARGEPWRGRDDMWFAPRGVLHDGGKVAFLFPGIDSSFQPRVDDVVDAFALPWAAPAGGTELMDLGMGIIALGRILHTALGALGIAPDVIAGHSIGEWSAMLASEMIPPADVDPLIARLAPERVEVPGVAFVAVGAGVARTLPAIAGLESIAVSHDNCPHQVILCGRDADCDTAVERLRAAGVLSQKLPFRSGYHSPLFADFVGPHRRILAEVSFVAPRVPVWSATTCLPYPGASEAVRELAVEHLLQPVRFRELTEALWEDGARVFVQVGTGSLVGFADDTLKGRAHLCIGANVPQRGGLAQLRRVVGAMWVEGKDELRAWLETDTDTETETGADTAAGTGTGTGTGTRADTGTSTTALARGAVPLSLGVPLVRLERRLALAAAGPSDDGAPEGSPLWAELSAGWREIGDARAEVLAAFGRAAADAGLGPREAVLRRRISVETHPELVDHSFYRQPAGWREMEDRYPVVPMTMLMELMMDAARELVPERLPVGLSGVRAARWLAVSPPAELSFHCRFDGHSRVEVEIRGYASGVVDLDLDYAEPPDADPTPIDATTPAPLSAARLYAERWMFHGPAYQGVRDVGVLGPGGIRGELVSLAARGGLLDNAGQLLGYWVMQQADIDRLAMPVSLSETRFFSPHPAPGEPVTCTVRVRQLSETQVRADVELAVRGKVWASIRGWTDRRFDSDPRVWSVLTFPEQNTIAAPHAEGFVLLRQPWRAAASRDLLSRRYLGVAERAALKGVLPRDQAPWLMARIAAKDCARHHLWERGAPPIFPIEVEAVDGGDGRFLARGGGAELRILVAHHPTGVAVARVLEGADGAGDADAHRAALVVEPLQDGEAAAAARARVAVAVAQRALGEGAPAAAAEVRETSDERVRVVAGGEALWVETALVDGHMVGWS